MTRKLLTTDEFRAAAKGGLRPDGTVLRLATGNPQMVEGADRTVRFIFSDGSVDRSGDTIDAKGWEVADFLKNPVALWAHDSFSPPIGRAANVAPANGKLMGDIEFMPPDVSSFADTIFRMVKGGYINAVSVGFIPLEWEFVNDKDRPYGIDFTKQELLEISVCPVPCNANALAEARAKGIDTAPLREWAERLLDTGGSVIVPRDLLEETFRQAKTPRAVRQKYLAKSESSDWKVGAARDLPTDDADGWDGPAAAKRMLDEAGFDGDSPDAAKAARGFLIHDTANPTLRGSYKLPFADIIGGTLKAVKGGVHAAASRLMQTDAPAAVLEDAKTVLDAYEKKFGDGGKSKAMGDDDVPTGTCGRQKDDECGMADPRECAVHAPTGSCGRDEDETCGMKDPAECAIHAAPMPDKTAAPAQEKSGRRISRANEALLHKAMDHHESATKCIKDVLASNETGGPDDDADSNDPNDLTIPLSDEDKRKQRIRDAKALIASIEPVEL